MLQQVDFAPKMVQKGDVIKLHSIAWFNRNLVKGFNSIPNFFMKSELLVTPAHKPILGRVFEVEKLDENYIDGCVINWEGRLVTIPTWLISLVG